MLTDTNTKIMSCMSPCFTKSQAKSRVKTSLSKHRYNKNPISTFGPYDYNQRTTFNDIYQSHKKFFESVTDEVGCHTYFRMHLRTPITNL